MQPNGSSNQNQNTTDLPSVLPSPLPPSQLAASSSPAQTSISATDHTKQVTTQAKQLFAQYDNQPAELSDALQQLKSDYIASQFGVAPKTVDR